MTLTQTNTDVSKKTQYTLLRLKIYLAPSLGHLNMGEFPKPNGKPIMKMQCDSVMGYMVFYTAACFVCVYMCGNFNKLYVER